MLCSLLGIATVTNLCALCGHLCIGFVKWQECCAHGLGWAWGLAVTGQKWCAALTTLVDDNTSSGCCALEAEVEEELLWLKTAPKPPSSGLLSRLVLCTRLPSLSRIENKGPSLPEDAVSKSSAPVSREPIIKF